MKEMGEMEKQKVSGMTLQISQNEGMHSHGRYQNQRNAWQGRESHERKTFIDGLKAQANEQKQSHKERIQHRAQALHDHVANDRIQRRIKINGESSNLMKGISIRGASKDEKDAIERILKGNGKKS